MNIWWYKPICGNFANFGISKLWIGWSVLFDGWWNYLYCTVTCLPVLEKNGENHDIVRAFNKTDITQGTNDPMYEFDLKKQDLHE